MFRGPSNTNSIESRYILESLIHHFERNHLSLGVHKPLGDTVQGVTHSVCTNL